MRLGARVTAFNTFVRAWDLAYMLEHSGVDVLVTLERFRSSNYVSTMADLAPELASGGGSSGRFPKLREIVVLDDADVPRNQPLPPGLRPLSQILTASAGGAAPTLRSAVDIACVLYTSGSSARPKAVPLQHYAMIENAFHIGERMELVPEDRVWVAVPLFWAYGACNALPAVLTHGAALVLQQAFDAGEALDLIEHYGCTVAYTLPNMTNALIAHASFAARRTSTLRTGLTIGGPREIRRTAEQLRIPRICNLYGQTETYGNCCVTPASWPLERKEVSQGPPLDGVELSIRDAQGDPLPTGVVGEIHVRGYLSLGYLDNASETASSFGADGWFSTGDLGAVDDAGCLRFVARSTEMIKTGGVNVAPAEVEELLRSHEDVDEAAVVGVDDERMDQVVVAFVVSRAAHPPSEDELRAWCADRVAGYKTPARIHFVPELAKTDTGKVARAKLVEADVERAMPGRS
jgi:fatty-acyl-CoA synthase